jgi:hypothetical protein
VNTLHTSVAGEIIAREIASYELAIMDCAAWLAKRDQPELAAEMSDHFFQTEIKKAEK